MKSKIALCLTFIFLLCLRAEAEDFGEDEFGAEEKEGRSFYISDGLAPINLFLIGFYKGADKVLIRPISIGYRTLTPPILRHGIQNSFNFITSVLYLPNSLLVFNIPGAIINTGYILSSFTLGGGFSGISKDFNLKESPVKFSSLFRFYLIPELFYFTLGPIIMTFPDIAAIAAGSFITNLFFPSIIFSTLSAGVFINFRTENLEALDAIFALSNFSIYENLKTNKYMEAKNFHIERKLLKQEGKALQKELQYSRNSYFLN